MFKVICVTDEDFCPWLENAGGFEPHVGDVVTVVRETMINEIVFYVLAEDFHRDGVYDSRNFSTLNGPDERKHLEERLTKEDATLKALAEACPDVVFPEDSKRRLWARIEEHLNATL